MIEVKDLTFSYRGKKKKQALRGLTFTVKEGEIFGFLGPNGSGKSTTQKLLTGILRGYGGFVSLFGEDLSAALSPSFYEKIGVLFEFPYLYTNLSAVDNLKYFASFYPSQRVRNVMELLEQLEFKKDFLTKPVSSYSKGMRQRVSMARALMNNPRLLFLDEPTSGLDPSGAVLFRRIIEEERKKGTTVFLTTHNMMDADLLCDRVAFLSNGEIAALDTPSRLKENNSRHRVKVEYLYRGKRQESLLDAAALRAGLTIPHDELLRIHSQEPTWRRCFSTTRAEGFRELAGKGVLRLRGIWDLLKKDLQMMYAGKFFLLAFLSLVLYSCYINLVYVNINQEAIKRYLYDPSDQYIQNTSCIRVTDRAELEAACADRMSVGIDVSGDTPQIYMLSSGKDTVDRYLSIWAQAVLAEAAPHFKYSGVQESVQIIGQFDKAEKSRREMTAEVLFFELSAVGFLGLASVLFKEKQMGVLRLHGIMPVSKVAFILSKTGVFLGADLIFTVLLTMVNVGVGDSAAILPKLLPHAAGLSVFMTLTGFLCALWLSDFKQFSLFYLVIAIFVTTPVFLVEQSGIAWDWIVWHPMYHLFRAVKAAYFETAAAPPSYYIISAGVLVLLLAAVFGALSREMAAEG